MGLTVRRRRADKAICTTRDLSVDGRWAVCSTHQRKTLLWETHRPTTRPVECADTSGRHAPVFSESGRKPAVPAERHLPLWSIGPWRMLAVAERGGRITLLDVSGDTPPRPGR
ncbi:hypothetical protein [Streptomyces sp. NPDC058773]|uniref:hypothetical protein n=1 Tax=Streptomyces sp. NPDC058773 TaxID=3346632 RepID=UPI003682F7AC